MTLEHERKNKTYQITNLNDHLEKFLRTLESDATISNYRHVIRDFIQYLKNNNVSKLTEDNATDELNSYLIYLNKNTNLKSVSIDNYCNRIKSFLNRCLRLNIGKTTWGQNDKSIARAMAEMGRIGKYYRLGDLSIS